MKWLKVFLARAVLMAIATITVWASTFGMMAEPSHMPFYAELIASAILWVVFGLSFWAIGRLVIVAFKIEFK